MMFTRVTSYFCVLFVATLVGTLVSSPALAQEPGSSSVEVVEQESLDVRYARAHLKLAELDWQRFLDVQKQFPNVLPIEAGEDLKRHVLIDEEQLKQALKGPDADMHQIYIRSAKMAVESCKRDLQRKQQANVEFPSKTQALAVDRAEAALQLSQLHLEITLTKKKQLSTMMYLQWQIEVLRNQVLELQVQLKSESRRN